MMTEQHSIDIADRCSRKRAMLLAATALLFGSQSALFGPACLAAGEENHALLLLWSIYAAVAFVLVVTGGAFLKEKRIRALMNDEVTQAHRQIALAAGFCTAVLAAFALLAAPAMLSARAAGYIITSSSLTAALFAWALLELRALRDS